MRIKSSDTNFSRPIGHGVDRNFQGVKVLSTRRQRMWSYIYPNTSGDAVLSPVTT